MRFFKIIGVIFVIYFIRRFMQMYRLMKHMQEQNLKAGQEATSTDGPRLRPKRDSSVIDADFKIIKDS